MRWLDECSRAALAEAVHLVAPELDGAVIALPERVDSADPRWWASSAAIGDRHVAKFAWSEPAAERIVHELEVLAALEECGVPFLPPVVAASRNPLLLVTRRVPGVSLFAVVDGIDRDAAGGQLARFLTALHGPVVREHVDRRVGGLAPADQGVQHPAATPLLRERLGPWLGDGRHEVVRRWCDWADAVLDWLGPAVVVHADLHGDNQVWDHGALKAVVDFETVCLAEPEYDLRALPDIGPGMELLAATIRHYERLAGRRLALDRVMAWHLRTVLWDVLWRSEAGAAMPGGSTPADRVDELAERLRLAGAVV